LRAFEGKKANYSEVGGKFDVEWKDGLFRRVIGQTGFAKMAADQKAEDLFLSQLARFDGSGRSVSDSPGASSPTASRLNSSDAVYPSNTFLPHQELIRGVHHFEGGSVGLAAALKSPVPTMVQALPTT
jgi:hypothetical protein